MASRPGVDELSGVLDAMREWQTDDALAGRLIADLDVEGADCIEARFDRSLTERLRAGGWVDDEPWTPLRRDLTDPVQDCARRITVVGPKEAQARSLVQTAAFAHSTFTVDKWHAMTAGPAYRDARCLIAHDDDDTPVATVTVWSAGPRRPGLLEPMGVHREHRGRGHGPDDHAGRGGRTPRARQQQRDRVHPDCEPRSGRHLPLGRADRAAGDDRSAAASVTGDVRHGCGTIRWSSSWFLANWALHRGSR
jgi:hypothetical protein